MTLKPWYNIITPREDLVSGKPIDASEFEMHHDHVSIIYFTNEPTTPKNNQLLKMLLILAIVFSPFLSFSQETVGGPEVDGDRKNSIKGMPYVVGIFLWEDMPGYRPVMNDKSINIMSLK